MSGMVIIGGGLAAETAAKKLRKEGFSGDITVIASEPHSLYQRPPLSKGYLAGQDGLDAVMLHDYAWYSEQRITVLAGAAATEIDTQRREVRFSDGGALPYNKLLIATGCSARRLEVEGNDLDGVHTLRTIDDADALRIALASGEQRLAIIGSGWIGMEVAATATDLASLVV